ncbi:MAG: isoaspartyl peptidase/L-asparaginase [Bacteroidetes bacterium]|nr:isoaspartyl peptidase/L-asparaginase [Bacteroidota bacterium]
MRKIALALHGGAGTILKSTMTPEKEIAYKTALDEALNIGYSALEKGASSLDAVEATVMSLENCPLFNAGKGSVFTNAGSHEMDAAIMIGKDLMAGAVAGISGVKNPVHLARMIMEKSEHVMLSGAGAAEFAKLLKLDFENEDYFFNQFRYDQFLEIRDTDKFQLDHTEKKFGTVGAVALDQNGNIAAATSTGGMTNKRFNRVGDSPIIGAGTYANNNTCAISCTGHGEFFIRAVVAYDISCLIEYKGLSLTEACEFVVNDKLKKFSGEGGLVALNTNGDCVLTFNSDGMYRAWKTSENKKGVEIYR